MADVYLGIDLGTTSVKAALLDAEGRLPAQFGQSYTIDRPTPDCAEQDPGDWTRLIDTALERLASETQATVRAGALTSQVNTHVFVDREGRPLIPAIVWQDNRAAAEARELDRRLSEADKIALLGALVPIDASHPLARMAWVRRHLPEVWEKTAHVLLPKDFALLHLTGRLATDPLSNIGLVGPSGSYVAEILDLVPGAAERMAPLAGITDVVGEVAAGPFRGVPMVNATMDGWVGLAGAGAVHEGRTVYVSGTSEILGVCSRTVNNEPGVVTFAETEGLRLHAGPTQSGGASAEWFCGLAGLDVTDMPAVADQAKGRSPLFLPHLAGERAPLWDSSLRGIFLGVEAGMSTPEFAKAVYEGVAMSARHLLGALEASSGIVADTLSCGGGGFRADYWGQIRASVLGKRLERLAVGEPGIVGAVCIAARAAGGYASLTEAHAAFARIDRVWEPDPAATARYDELFGIYLDAIAANADLGRRLTAIGI